MVNDPGEGRGTIRAQLSASVEAGIAALPLAWILQNPGLRALLAAGARAIVDGLRSSLILTFVDPATILPVLGALARAALLLAPPARALARSPRHRLAWAPITLLVWIAVFGVSVPAAHSVITWAALALAACAAWIAAARPWIKIAAFLPWIVALEPTLGHSPLGDDVWTPARLADRCAKNDGVRPEDLSPAWMGTRYYAVTPASHDWLLLTGERRSFWVKRDPAGAMRLGDPLRLPGNLWQGCVRDGTAWVTCRELGVCEAPVPNVGEPVTEPFCHKAPGARSLGVELDYVDPICPRDRPTVYTSQLLRGGYLEVDPRSGASTFHPVIPGLNLQMVERRDGVLLTITTGRFAVFDPRADRVLEEHAAGVVAMGLDVCTRDDAVAITDFTGRVRLFERGPGGAYRFTRGGFVPAPRRVAFSPSCDRLVVTSGDDRRAFLLRRGDLGVARSYLLGPGLRDVVFLDETHFAAADACTINVLDAPP